MHACAQIRHHSSLLYFLVQDVHDVICILSLETLTVYLHLTGQYVGPGQPLEEAARDGEEADPVDSPDPDGPAASEAPSTPNIPTAAGPAGASGSACTLLNVTLVPLQS